MPLLPLKACKPTSWCTSKIVTRGPESSQSRTASFLGRTLTLRQWRIEYKPDQQHVSRDLKALGLTAAKGVATPTDDVSGPKASQISELRRKAKWHDPPEEGREEDDLLTGEELKLFQSVSARFNFLAMDRRVDAKNGFTTYTGPHCPQESCTVHNQIPANDLQKSMDQSDNNIEVFGDATFAGCHSTRKSTVGGVAMWSGQFVKAWSKTVGVLAMIEQRRVRIGSGGEGSNRSWDCSQFRTTSVCVAMWQSNLTQPQQSGWSTGSDWEKSDIWLLETCGCNTMLFEFPKCPGLENPSDAQTKYLGPEPLLRHTKTCNWVPVVDDDKS